MRCFVHSVMLRIGAAALCLCGIVLSANGAAAPERERLLIISMALNSMPPVDVAYTNHLTEHGFDVTVATHEDLLSAAYLRQFPAIVLGNLPYAGEQYDVHGYKLRNVATNLALIHGYIAAGGGLLLTPAMVEFGEAYGETYNTFLAPYGASYLIQQLRDEASSGTTPYATGVVVKGHPITQNIATDAVLYPVRVMRWDNAYSTTPLVTSDKAWTVLARGGAASGTAIAINNIDVGPRQTQQRTLFAVRPYGKGMVAASAIGAYYTLTAVSSRAEAIGENATGVIDFAVISGEKGGRPSAFGAMIENTLRALAANSRKHGLGAATDVARPSQPPYPASSPTIDWETRQPPPTWAHRVIPGGTWPDKTYDDLPDPLINGEMRYWRTLVGPRSRYSSGSGAVREYRAAAQRAGYNAIVFAETFADLSAKTWGHLVQDCADNSDDTFVCLPGMEIEGVNGGRYLVLCSDRFPDPAWLSADGKKLAAIRMLSLGWHRHIAVMARPNNQQLEPRLFKQYQGIAVATYNSDGRLIDDGLYAYQWALANDCNPLPIAVHEVTNPNDVAKAAASGFQQILPAPTLAQAMSYFRFAMPHYFDCPPRYFLSEGPILDGWSIANKDTGKPELNRDRYRMGIGVRGDGSPISEAILYDGFQAVRRWQPATDTFQTVIDGRHDMQHLYLLQARDARGRRLLSPAIRTTTRNWRLRCGDRQNWLGHFWIYTGWHLNNMPGYELRLNGTREGALRWNGAAAGGNPAPVFDYRFFSDHVQMVDADLGAKYIDATYADIAGDGANGAPMRPTDVVRGHISATCFTVPKRPDFAVLEYTVRIVLKQDALLDTATPINPVMGGVFKGKNNKLLILPAEKPEPLIPTITDPSDKAATAPRTLDLPIGAYVAGVIPLTDGLTLHGDRFGYRVAQDDLANAAAGTSWAARYLILDSTPFVWRRSRTWNETSVDDKAEQALSEMGFRGPLPYRFELRQGKHERTAYAAYFTAANGGIAGRCLNTSGQPMLFYVPLRISGLNPRAAAILWRADRGTLEPFAQYQGEGYVTFDADTTVEFYAGNVAACDPRLAVEIIAWTAATARFRLHNPTTAAITTSFATPAAVTGYKALTTNVSVPPGSSLEIGH